MALIPKFTNEYLTILQSILDSSSDPCGTKIILSLIQNTSYLSKYSVIEFLKRKFVFQHQWKIHIFVPSYDIYHINKYVIDDIMGYILNMCIPEKLHKKRYCKCCRTARICRRYCWCGLTLVCKKWHVLSKPFILNRPTDNQMLESHVFSAADLKAFHKAGTGRPVRPVGVGMTRIRELLEVEERSKIKGLLIPSQRKLFYSRSGLTD